MALNEHQGGGGDRDPLLDRLYRAAGREEPPAELDAAIRAAARREVGAGPRSISRLRAWRVPISLAAVLVLSASLVMLMREEGGEALVHPGQPGATASADLYSSSREAPKTVAPAERSTPERDAAVSRPEARQGGGGRDDGDARRDRAPGPRGLSVEPARESTAKTSPPPVQWGADLARTVPAERQQGVEDRMRAPAATTDSRVAPPVGATASEAAGGFAAESPRPAPSADRKPVAPAPQPQSRPLRSEPEAAGGPPADWPQAAPAPAPARSAGATSSLMKKPALSESEPPRDIAAELPRPAPVVPPPAKAAAPQAKMAPPPAMKPAPRREEGFGEFGASRGADAPPATAAREAPRVLDDASARNREGAPVLTPRTAALVKELDAQPPEKWLARIEELRRAGRLAEAEELTVEFKRRFPAHR
jgi:hypothetical protein